MLNLPQFSSVSTNSLRLSALDRRDDDGLIDDFEPAGDATERPMRSFPDALLDDAAWAADRLERLADHVCRIDAILYPSRLTTNDERLTQCMALLSEMRNAYAAVPGAVREAKEAARAV